MKICIAVSEFNPFHNGHAEFLRQCRALTGADAVVCAMAGNVTQRGEFAVMEKRTRAEIALLSGADGVIELPTPVAVANAERFARGAVALFSGMQAELCLCCGSEIADRNLLLAAADFFMKEPKDYRKAVKEFLRGGESLPRAREKALTRVGREKLCPLLQNPNSVLALEYAKACKRANVAFFVYQRTGEYHEASLPENADSISGTAVRAAITEGRKEEVKPFLPEACFARLPHRLPRAEDYMLGALTAKSAEEIRRLPDCTEGLENRIYHALRTACDFTAFLEGVKTKRYVMSRIRRICACALLGVEEKVSRACALRAPYIRLLGIRKDANGLLAALSTAKAPLICRRKDAEKLKGAARLAFMADERAEAVFRLLTGESYPFFIKV